MLKKFDNVEQEAIVREVSNLKIRNKDLERENKQLRELFNQAEQTVQFYRNQCLKFYEVKKGE